MWCHMTIKVITVAAKMSRWQNGRSQQNGEKVHFTITGVTEKRTGNEKRSCECLLFIDCTSVIYISGDHAHSRSGHEQ